MRRLAASATPGPVARRSCRRSSERPKDTQNARSTTRMTPPAFRAGRGRREASTNICSPRRPILLQIRSGRVDSSEAGRATTKAAIRRPCVNWSGRRVSNPRPKAWEAFALPTELRPRALRPSTRGQVYRSPSRASSRSRARHSATRKAQGGPPFGLPQDEGKQRESDGQDGLPGADRVGGMVTGCDESKRARMDIHVSTVLSARGVERAAHLYDVSLMLVVAEDRSLGAPTVRAGTRPCRSCIRTDRRPLRRS